MAYSYQKVKQKFLRLNKLLIKIKYEKRKKISQILKFRKKFKLFRFQINDKILMTKIIPYSVLRRLKTVVIKGGELAGLANKYYRPYYPNYRKLIKKTLKKNKRRHYLSFMRIKMKQVTLSKYIAQCIKPGGLTKKTLRKQGKTGLYKLMNTLFLKKIKIPPKYKKTMLFYKKIRKINKIRYSKLQITEFQNWSEQIIQQIHGKY